MTKNWILLQCEARGVPPLTVEWKNGAGNILKSESTPKSETGSPSSITLNITVTKTDDYSCVATQKEFSHEIAAVIPVYIQGAASELSVKTIKEDDGMMLQCEVLSASPKPKVEWKDGSGNVLPVKEVMEAEKGGLYYIVLRAAVTKTDTFRCVVTQEEIGHQTEAEIYVVMGWYVWWILVGAAIIFCVLVVVIIILCCKLRSARRHRAAINFMTETPTGNQPMMSENDLELLEQLSE